MLFKMSGTTMEIESYLGKYPKLANNFIPKVGQKLAVTIFIYLWFMACEKLVNVSGNYIYLWFMACEKLVNVSSNYFVICSVS